MFEVSEDCPIVFVYGTLKRGECRAHFLSEGTYLGLGKTVPQFRLYDCGEYPGLVLASSGVSIEGEIWQVTDRIVAALDIEEGVDIGLYRREAVTLLPPFHTLNVETYLFQHEVEGLPDAGTVWKS